MRSSRALFIYLVVVFAGGALLGPQLYFLAQWLGGHFHWAERLVHTPLHRFVHRAMLILAVTGLWPLARAMGLCSWREVGWEFARRVWRRNFSNLGAGLLVGFLSLAVAAAVLVLEEAFQADTGRSPGEIAAHILKAGLAALAVSVLEETVFRGVLFGGLRKTQAWIPAALLSSAVYAIVHFFGKPPPPETVQWSSGFGTLTGMMQGFARVETMVPALITLFLAGMILAVAYQITGNLCFSAGLHAGWIFWLKSFQFFTVPSVTSTGPHNLLDSWSASLLLMAILAGLWWRQTQCGATKRHAS